MNFLTFHAFIRFLWFFQSVPATSLEPVTRTEAPGTTLVPKLSQQPEFPHPKPKTTRSPAAPPTELGKCVGPGLRILTAYPSSSYRK